MRFIVIIYFILLACNTSQKELSEKMLSEKKMISILSDVHLLKGKISVWRKTKAVSQLQEDSLFKLLYEKHDISKEILDSSLTYYTIKESDMLEQIYTEVLEQLKKQETDLGN